MIKKNIKAQVWVETVIYILIGLSLIALVLAVAKPKIEEQMDKLTLQRTIEAMTELENNIRDIKISGTSATRENDIKIGKGQLIIRPQEDLISFIIEDSAYPIGHPREDDPRIVNTLPGTGIVAVTEKKASKYKVTITLNYNDKYNVTYNSAKTERVLNSQPNIYRLMVENKGKVNYPFDNTTNINFYLNS